MLCPNCQSENRDGAKFCDECGFPLSGAIARAAAANAGMPPIDGAADAPQPMGDDDAPEPGADETSRLHPVLPEREVPSDSGDGPDEEAPVAGEPGEGQEGESPKGSGADDARDQETPAEEGPEPGSDAPAADVTSALETDLAGFERTAEDYGERVVGPGYEPPEANWRDGGTMQMPRVEGDEAPRSRDFLASSTRKQRHGARKAVIAVAVVAVLAAVAALVTYQMQVWGGKAVPDVTGMTQADATSVLEDAGFLVRAEQVRSDDTEGLVLIMDPDAGSRVDDGSEVVIHITTTRTVPEVVGKQQAQALALLADEGYTNVKVQEKPSGEQEGTVLAVAPEAGSRAKGTAEVTLTVAGPFTVPDVSGMYLDDAIQALQDAGLGYDVVYVNTESYPEGALMGTAPSAGTVVSEGAIVVIQIAQARGAELEQLTREYLAPGSTVAIGGTNYIIESLDSVSYLGNESVAYSATGRAFTYLLGETLFASGSQTISGTVTFTADNQVAATS